MFEDLKFPVRLISNVLMPAETKEKENCPMETITNRNCTTRSCLTYRIKLTYHKFRCEPTIIVPRRGHPFHHSRNWIITITVIMHAIFSVLRIINQLETQTLPKYEPKPEDIFVCAGIFGRMRA